MIFELIYNYLLNRCRPQQISQQSIQPQHAHQDLIALLVHCIYLQANLLKEFAVDIKQIWLLRFHQPVKV